MERLRGKPWKKALIQGEIRLKRLTAGRITKVLPPENNMLHVYYWMVKDQGGFETVGHAYNLKVNSDHALAVKCVQQCPAAENGFLMGERRARSEFANCEPAPGGSRNHVPWVKTMTEDDHRIMLKVQQAYSECKQRLLKPEEGLQQGEAAEKCLDLNKIPGKVENKNIIVVDLSESDEEDTKSVVMIDDEAEVNPDDENNQDSIETNQNVDQEDGENMEVFPNSPNVNQNGEEEEEEEFEESESDSEMDEHTAQEFAKMMMLEAEFQVIRQQDKIRELREKCIEYGVPLPEDDPEYFGEEATESGGENNEQSNSDE